MRKNIGKLLAVSVFTLSILSACGDASNGRPAVVTNPPQSNQATSIESVPQKNQLVELAASKQEVSTAKGTAVKTEKITLFPDGVSYYDGTKRLDQFEGTKKPANFKKDRNLPYGFYIPEIMVEYKLEDGTEWGMDKQRKLFSLFEKGQVTFKSNYSNPLLVKYKEYAGSEKDQYGSIQDYFNITAQGHKLVVRFHYFEKEKDATLPLFLNVLRTMRYVADPGKFKPGVAISFPKGANADEAAVIQLVKKGTAAIAAKDKKALHAVTGPLGNALDFLIDNKNKYRFTEIVRIAPYDKETKRRDIQIGYEVLEAGVVMHGNYIFTSLKDKAGKWYIANID